MATDLVSKNDLSLEDYAQDYICDEGRKKWFLNYCERTFCCIISEPIDFEAFSRYYEYFSKHRFDK